MLVGSVHLVETLEMLCWLGRVGYAGWISFDPHLNIEDNQRAMEECMRYLHGIISVLRRIGKEGIEDAIATRQAHGQIFLEI